MSSFIFTKHSLERLSQRSISQSDAELVLRNPDQTFPGKKEDTVKFIRTIHNRNIQIIATYLANEKKWLVISAWVRGENDRASIVWQLIAAPLKFLWWLLKKLFHRSRRN